MKTVRVRVKSDLRYKPYMNRSMMKYRGKIIKGYWDEKGNFRQENDGEWSWMWKPQDIIKIKASYEKRT